MSASKDGHGVVKPFKYRSIDDLAKRQILEQNRRELEAQHYGVQFRVNVLKALPESDNEAEMAQRVADITRMQDSLAVWEGMLDRYNDELLTLNENVNSNDQKG